MKVPQARSRRERMCLGRGRRAGGSSTLATEEGCPEGAELADACASGGAPFFGASGFGTPGSGCSTRPPAGASSLDTQELEPARLSHAASPAKRFLKSVRLVICVLLTIQDGGPQGGVPLGAQPGPGDLDPPAADDADPHGGLGPSVGPGLLLPVPRLHARRLAGLLAGREPARPAIAQSALAASRAPPSRGQTPPQRPQECSD